MTHVLIMFVACFGGSFASGVLVKWLIARSSVHRENGRLRAWIDRQAAPAAGGPFREAPPMPLFEDHREQLMGDGRPAAPPPTSTPSGGRRHEQ